jgi:predicted amidophosphoribosyltransferase
VDALRWKKPVESATTGGPRHAHILAQHLYVTRSLDKAAQYVLIDNVTTSGGHLKACAAILRQAGVQHIPCAAIAGRSVQLPPEDGWRVADEDML